MPKIYFKRGFIAIIRNKVLPVKGFAAINLFLILFVRPNVNLTDKLLNHERIHSRQILELGIIFFYIWYGIEWLIKSLKDGNAYKNLSFEREAYENENDENYLKTRKWYSFIKYI